MAPTTHPTREGAGPPNVATLIGEYRVLHEALRAHAENLARVREDVRRGAEDEARTVVTAARRDVRQVIAQALSDLRALTTTVQAWQDAHQELVAQGGDAGVPGAAGQDGHLRIVRDALATTRQEIPGILESTRPEIAELEAELDAFAARLRRKAAPVSSGVAAPAPSPSVSSHERRPASLEAAFEATPVFPSKSGT